MKGKYSIIAMMILLKRGIFHVLEICERMNSKGSFLSKCK